MRNAFFAFLVLGAFACGGRGALEAYAYDASNGGSGGAPPTAGGAPMTTTTVSASTTTSVSTSAGPATVVSTTTTGPGSCDNTGDCSSCLVCSSNGGKCTNVWSTCLQTPGCVAMLDCMETCLGVELIVCFEGCAPGNPGGAQLLEQAIVCTFCDECMNDCDDAGTGFCG